MKRNAEFGLRGAEFFLFRLPHLFIGFIWANLRTGFDECFIRRWAVALLSSCVMMLTGCSDGLPQRVPVSGMVLIDGQPLTKGSIMVIPQNERPAGGSIGPDGRFSLSSYKLNDGVVQGTHRVTVQATEHISERETRWLTPKKYGNPDTSGLSITVEKATDDAVIELTWGGGKPFVERM